MITWFLADFWKYFNLLYFISYYGTKIYTTASFVIISFEYRNSNHSLLKIIDQ
jgi:hypothetical protein